MGTCVLTIVFANGTQDGATSHHSALYIAGAIGHKTSLMEVHKNNNLASQGEQRNDPIVMSTHRDDVDDSFILAPIIWFNLEYRPVLYVHSDRIRSFCLTFKYFGIGWKRILRYGIKIDSTFFPYP